MHLECFRTVDQAILKYQIYHKNFRPSAGFFQHFLDSDPLLGIQNIDCLNLNNPKRDYPNLNTFFRSKLSKFKQ